MHEGFIAQGKIGQLEGKINHYTYKDIAHHVQAECSDLSANKRRLISKGDAIPWLDPNVRRKL